MIKIIVWLIIGMTIGGMWVQYRFSGDIWSNKPRENLCSEYVKAVNKEKPTSTNEIYEPAVRWDCREIESCPWRDWRYTKASDVCTYHMTKHILPFGQKPSASSDGTWCESELGEKINPK